MAFDNDDYDDYGSGGPTVSDYDEFEERLATCLEFSEYLTKPELEFVWDMETKFDEYADETYCSEAQYRWLKMLSMRLEQKARRLGTWSDYNEEEG